MLHSIRYAGAIEYDTARATWTRCTWPEAIRRAYAAAMEHAARYGDQVAELVSIDGRHVTAGENIDARAWYRAQASNC